MEFKKIAIATRYESRLARDIANMVAELINAKNSKVFTIAPLSLDGYKMLEDKDRLSEDLDLIIAIGGDGTTLRAVRWVDGKIPIFSIRIKGSRGVLADVSTDSIHEAIEMIYDNRFYIDERMRIYAIAEDQISQAAVNEIMISKITHLVTPNYTITIDGYEIRERMDGIIVSTAIGSSGYSYSFGGPILHEKSDSLLITPIASINRLPILVIPELEIMIECDTRFSLFVDGQRGIDSNKVIIKRYKENAKFLRIKRRGFNHLAKLGY